MCSIINCGFPLYSEMQEAYPAYLEKGNRPKYKEMKVWDFRRHIWNEHLVPDRVVYADGYKFSSSWYSEHNYSEWCINKLTGCRTGDSSCEDSHAYQQLVRGPFQAHVEEAFFKFLVGVPSNLKKAMLRLPHATAPRFDIGVHLRCQFRHFEYLVGPGDSLWPRHQQEIEQFLQSENYNAGEQLFKTVTMKLQEEIEQLLKLHEQVQTSNRRLEQVKRVLRLDIAAENASAAALEKEIEKSSFFSANSPSSMKTFHVYLASDNEDVKEAFAHYLIHHLNAHFNTSAGVRVAVMRVFTGRNIAHAKDIGWLKSESAGVFTLIADWYALSISNVVVAWRRDTHLLSTFAHSAQRYYGNSRIADGKVFEHTPFDVEANASSTAGTAIAGNVVERMKHSRGWQLVMTNGQTHWNHF